MTTKYGASIKFKVSVQKAKVVTKKIAGVKKNLTVKKGKTLNLAAVTNPITSPENIKYKLSSTRFASISSKGVLKGKKKGKVVLTITSGKVKLVVNVTVK